VTRIASRCGFALLVALTALAASGANAQTVTVPAAADTYLRQVQANQGQGQDVVLHIQEAGNNRNRALVRMDPAAIAAAASGKSLVSATLELYATNSGGWGSSGGMIALHRLSTSWTEAGATWNCA
jgi:hypothetical protein